MCSRKNIISSQLLAVRYQLPLQQIHFVHIDRFFVTEEGDQNAQTDSGLRRRIPQAHLSAQLRTPEPEVVAPVLDPPSTVNAAAALSRYQASRAAAQARVGNGLPVDPARTTDGDRE